MVIRIDNLTDDEAVAILHMLNEAIDLHLGDAMFNVHDWEYFDLDAARLSAYKKYRTWYEMIYGKENENETKEG